MHNPLDVDYLVTADWETYYDSSYSLRNMTYIEYIRSPKFKEHGVSIQINDSDPIWYTSNTSIKKALNEIPWNKAALIGHNLHFDGSILSFIHDIIPKYYIDTISLARGILPTIESYSLKYVANYLGIGHKDSTRLGEVKGIENPDKEQLAGLGVYCKDDVILTWKVYEKLAPFLPINEYKLIDQTIKMQTQPQLMLDREKLEGVIETKLAERQDVLETAGVDISTVRSSVKLIERFRELGVDPPMKISPRTGKQAPAFAKTDLGMQKLVHDPDPRVAALAKARLTCMSNIDIKRAERFIAIHDCNKGSLPVPLNYYGAHTGRWSGGDKINMQNLTKKSGLRYCIIAPEGHLILAADQSQIEARITAWLADHMRLLRDFRSKDEGISPYDVYQIMASHIYNIEVKQVNEEQRFIGKMCVLGLGYGMGYEKLGTVLNQILGAGSISEYEAKNMVDIYRSINTPIVQLWGSMTEILNQMVHQREGVFKCLTYDPHSIKLPNGMYLQYPFLNMTTNDWGGPQYEYTYQEKSQKIYGGRLTENIVQALARSVIADNMLTINERYQVATMTHDEIVIVPRKSEIEEATAFVTEVMSTPPDWATDLPLALEIEIDERYSK
jgi:DNA polymerase